MGSSPGKTGGEQNLGPVLVGTFTVGVKGGSDITNNVPYRSLSAFKTWARGIHALSHNTK
jgi:hypothetical protein